MVNNIVLFYKYFFVMLRFSGCFHPCCVTDEERIVNFIIMRIYYPAWIFDRYYMSSPHLALKPFFSYFCLMYIPTPPTSLANLAPPTYYSFIWPLLFLLWNPCPMVSHILTLLADLNTNKTLDNSRITLMVNLGMLKLLILETTRYNLKRVAIL